MSSSDSERRKYLNDTYADRYVQNAYDYESDKYKDDRLKSHTCKFCYYFNNDLISLAVITTYECPYCGKQLVSGSSHQQHCCEDCAKEKKICIECGGDMD